MKIDEACINHNVVNIAKDASGWLIDTNVDENFAEITGIVGSIDGLNIVLEKLKERVEE